MSAGPRARSNPFITSAAFGRGEAMNSCLEVFLAFLWSEPLMGGGQAPPDALTEPTKSSSTLRQRRTLSKAAGLDTQSITT